MSTRTPGLFVFYNNELFLKYPNYQSCKLIELAECTADFSWVSLVDCFCNDAQAFISTLIDDPSAYILAENDSTQLPLRIECQINQWVQRYEPFYRLERLYPKAIAAIHDMRVIVFQCIKVGINAQLWTFGLMNSLMGTGIVDDEMMNDMCTKTINQAINSTCRDVMLLKNATRPPCIDDILHHMYRAEAAAFVIQHHFRYANANPNMQMCKRRLSYEFENI